MTKPAVQSTSEEEFQRIPLRTLRPASYNPRRNFDAKGLEELAATIRTHGVMEPLVVRPLGDGYEVVAGERRRRAAKLAGLEIVPVCIKRLTDAQAREWQMIENLQREDVHPLEEAQGYQALLDLPEDPTRPKYDVAGIAQKIGKSASYVYQRLKLCELVPPAQKAFLADQLSAAHAVLMARLQAKDQAAALEMAAGPHGAPLSVRELARWIQEQIHRNLAAAPWKKDDASLVPQAGACTTCPKRTGSNPDLYPDVRHKDTCTDPACYQAKQQAFLERKKSELQAEGAKVLQVSSHYQPEAKGLLGAGRYEEVRGARCPHAQPALMTDGAEAGKLIEVCTNPTCPKHRGRYGPSPERRESQKRAQQKGREINAVRAVLLDRVLAKAPERLARAEWELLAQALFEHLDHEEEKRVAGVHGWKLRAHQWSFEPVARRAIPEMSDGELARFLVELALVRDAEWRPYGRGSSDSGEKLLAAARRYKVDVAQAERETRAALRRPKGRTVQSSAKAKPKGKAHAARA